MASPSDLQRLVRQSNRYRVAAGQDADPAIAVLHANYAFAFAEAARQLADDGAILAATGSSGRALEAAAARAQDDAAARLEALCPALRVRGRL